MNPVFLTCRRPVGRLPSPSLPKKQLRTRAFTLIEMLVVVGVLALLTVLVVQGLSDSKASSMEAQIKGNLRSLNQAHMRAFLVGDPGRPTALGWDKYDAAQWYISNGYMVLPDFDPSVLDYIDLMPVNIGDDPYIWKRSTNN